MTTQITTKLTALSVALFVNCMMIISVAYLFNGRIHDSAWLQAQSAGHFQVLAPATPGAAATGTGLAA
jgi:hypothetical protein